MLPAMLRRVLPLCLLLIACGGARAPSDSTTAATTTTPTTTAPATTTTASTTTTAAADAAPPELAGTWEGEVEPGDPVTLSLNGNSYTISRGSAAGSGRIAVEGDIIVFSGSSLCDGVGTYRWTIDAETLILEMTEAGDPCSGRRPALDGVVYS